MKKPTDSVVKPGVVSFDDTKAQADPLHEPTAPQGPAQSTASQSNTSYDLLAQHANAMLTDIRYNNVSGQRLNGALPAPFIPLLGQKLMLIESRTNTSWARAQLVDMKNREITTILEGIYGAELKDSGLYERHRLHDSQAPFNFQGNCTGMFPELALLYVWNEFYTPIKDSRWLFALTLPVAVRPFFIGLNAKVEPTPQTSNLSIWNKAYSLPQVLAHAKAVGEVPSVAKYYDLLATPVKRET